MASNTVLSTPSIIVNNDVWAIVPNSFKYAGGEPEISVRSASAGGGTSSSVHAINAETQIGKCSFDMYLTSDLDSKIAVLKENVGSNAVAAVQKFSDGTSVVLSFNNMSVTNIVEREASADGVTSIEMEGDAMSIV